MNPEIAAQKIKRIMKDNCFRRRTLTTSGKIEFNRLAFHSSSRMLFSKESERQGKEYYVELLLDASGSMWHDISGGSSFFSSLDKTGESGRIKLAAESVEMIAKSMGKYCNLNITLFNYLEKKVGWKDFKAKKYQHLDIYPNIAQVGDAEGRKHIVESAKAVNFPSADWVAEGEDGNKCIGGNWEIINILNAAQRLKPKKGKKIIMVLLDGQPSMDYHNPQQAIHLSGRRVDQNPRTQYRRTIEGLIKSGIEVMGFGIQTESPKEFFPDFYKIDTPEEILPTLITALQQHIK